MSDRLTCAWCLRSYLVRSDDRLRFHRTATGLVCPGSGVMASALRLREDPAPAVPVGVQPEPAEEGWQPVQGWRAYTDALLARQDRIQVLAAMWEQSSQPDAQKAGRILADVLLSGHDCDGGRFDRTVCPDPCGADRHRAQPRWIAALYPHGSEYPPRVERAMAEADREVAGLRTQLEAEKQKHADHMHRCAAFVCDITPRALKAEGQVAAIRALADTIEAEIAGFHIAGTQTVVDRIRAALVASSPTTPELPAPTSTERRQP